MVQSRKGVDPLPADLAQVRSAGRILNPFFKTSSRDTVIWGVNLNRVGKEICAV